MQFHQKGGEMKYLSITAILLLSSCINSSHRKQNIDNRNIQPVRFNTIDTNQDGKITKQEAEQYNDLKKPDTDLLTPIYISTGILLASVIACTILIKKRNGDINT